MIQSIDINKIYTAIAYLKDAHESNITQAIRIYRYKAKELLIEVLEDLDDLELSKESEGSFCDCKLCIYRITCIHNKAMCTFKLDME